MPRRRRPTECHHPRLLDTHPGPNGGAAEAAGPPVRWARIRRLRRAIARGDYATEARLEAAAARLLERAS